MLPRWAEISSLSEDELYAAFRNTTHTFPPSFLVHRNSVRRIAIDAVMKVGSLEDSELLAMTLVAEQTTIPVPTIRKVFGQGRERAVVMDYIPGKTLANCWQDLSIWRRVHVIWKIHGFEYVTMRQSWDFLGRWKLWVVGFMAGFYERQLRFIGSIGWALNTGVLLLEVSLRHQPHVYVYTEGSLQIIRTPIVLAGTLLSTSRKI
ncbi:hypothetical protein C8Q70DRAFT_311039 [Cubamyces menziesii]|nr:hypothetical protein C8Q70DRAFT_311039 [Cubamyces menziesii]